MRPHEIVARDRPKRLTRTISSVSLGWPCVTSMAVVPDTPSASPRTLTIVNRLEGGGGPLRCQHLSTSGRGAGAEQISRYPPWYPRYGQLQQAVPGLVRAALHAQSSRSRSARLCRGTQRGTRCRYAFWSWCWSSSLPWFALRFATPMARTWALVIAGWRQISTPVCSAIFFRIKPLAKSFSKSTLNPPAALAPWRVLPHISSSRTASTKSWPDQVS